MANFIRLKTGKGSTIHINIDLITYVDESSEGAMEVHFPNTKIFLMSQDAEALQTALNFRALNRTYIKTEEGEGLPDPGYNGD
jgi:hypothetical protein